MVWSIPRERESSLACRLPSWPCSDKDGWRRRADSNRRITVLQTVPLATWVRRRRFNIVPLEEAAARLNPLSARRSFFAWSLSGRWKGARAAPEQSVPEFCNQVVTHRQQETEGRELRKRKNQRKGKRRYCHDPHPGISTDQDRLCLQHHASVGVAFGYSFGRLEYLNPKRLPLAFCPAFDPKLRRVAEVAATIIKECPFCHHLILRFTGWERGWLGSNGAHS